MKNPRMHRSRRVWIGIALIGLALFSAAPPAAKAASSKFCEGGGFSILLRGGLPPITGDTETTIPAAALGLSFTDSQLQGRHTARRCSGGNR